MCLMCHTFLGPRSSRARLDAARPYERIAAHFLVFGEYKTVAKTVT
jgi:hypothetical protein